MDIADILKSSPPQPWSGKDKIPWDDPEFSRRMLAEHLDQSHGLASRPFAKIDEHVEFLHRTILGARPSRILDLGCGPGLYADRLSKLGHTVKGIDFSPASIEYAQSNCQGEFVLGDLRQLDWGEGYELAMMVFGEANTFSPVHLVDLLLKARRALSPGGKILLEMSDEAAALKIGLSSPTWSRSQGGLFDPGPHLILEESAWDPDLEAAVRRWTVIRPSGDVRTYNSTTQVYAPSRIRQLLQYAGFAEVCSYPSLIGTEDRETPDLTVWVGRA